jgi:hypothetical protein
MTARSQPPVEPLSRSAWDRVEARLFERLDAGEHLAEPPAPVAPVGRARLWLGGAAFAAAAALALVWQLSPPPSPLASDTAVVPAPVLAPQPLPRDTTHIVTNGAPTRTTIGETTLILGAESEVHVDGADDSGWLVRLDRGEVDCEVAPRNGRPPFVVQAGETRVTVVGTRFTVTREGFAARVRVREGLVQVASGANQLRLGAGEQWPPEPAMTAPEQRPAPAGPLPRAQARARKAVPAPQAATPGDRFEKAARLEADDPEAALALYRSLGRGKGRWAANALYAEARLELERGRPDRARVALRRYLERHPNGQNSSDVRSLLERIDER